eukprot:1147992-Pelagomonas_calceolata.AAC.5
MHQETDAFEERFAHEDRARNTQARNERLEDHTYRLLQQRHTRNLLAKGHFTREHAHTRSRVCTWVLLQEEKLSLEVLNSAGVLEGGDHLAIPGAFEVGVIPASMHVWGDDT